MNADNVGEKIKIKVLNEDQAIDEEVHYPQL